MGFEKYSDSFINFALLNKNLDSSKQGAYYHKWKKRYDNITPDERLIIEWDIRNRKALKEIATSATFFIEAELVRKSNCYSAYYFLSYYSLFHAMLSTLYLNDEIKLSALVELPHNKVQNHFVNNFRPKRDPILSNDIDSHFTLLKSLREYYSYSMPMNEFFHLSDFELPEDFLEDDIKQCFQLTSLHSLIVSNSLKGVLKPHELNEEHWHYFDEWFRKVNAKKHPFGESYILDPSDRNVINEIVRYGFGLQHITIDLEHFLDEFKTYQSAVDEDGGLDIQKIWDMLYETLM